MHVWKWSNGDWSMVKQLNHMFGGMPGHPLASITRRHCLRLPYISVFSIHSSRAIGFHSCFFFTTDVSAPIRSTIHLLLLILSSHVWDWLWYPMLWSQRRNMLCA